MTNERVGVALYARISEDAAGEGIGVRRQLDACRDLAESRGWQVVAEATDNDVSALRGKHRPGYQQVLALVRGAKVQHVVVWQTSRLLRNRRERAEAIELFGAQRVGIITVKGQDLDLSNAYGRGMAGMLGEFDTMESEVKSERVAAAAADRARSGRPNGALGYGWITEGKGRDATFREHPTEAAVVREIVDRLAASESLHGVTNDLNARGIDPPGHAERWGKTSVKKVALRPSNAGLRLHHRGTPTETLYDGVWPPLVTRAKWERVCGLLAAPERRTNGTTVRPGARRHLLTWGIGACGVCGGRLRVALRGNARHGTKQQLYVCDANGCTGRNQAAVDEMVRGVVLARLSREDAFDWLLGDDEEARRQSARAADLRGRLLAAADRYAEGRITDDQLDRITAKIRPQLDAAEDAERRALRSVDLDALHDLAGPKAADRWDSMTMPERRAVLDTLGARVLVDKVKRRGPGFDPESVRVEWRRA